MKKRILLVAFVSILCVSIAKKNTIDSKIKNNELHSKSTFNNGPMPVANSATTSKPVKENLTTSDENGDEKDVPYFAAKYSKGLPHNTYGILTQEGQTSYKKLVTELNENPKTYPKLDLVDTAVDKQPVDWARFSFPDSDSAMSTLPPFPKLCSKEAAAQLIETYLLAIARDVFFSEYGTAKGSDKDSDGTSITKKAALVLSNLGTSYHGPVASTGKVTPELLFRGNNQGSLPGPYISQFLYLPLSIPISEFHTGMGIQNLPLSQFEITQQYPIPSTKSFGITLSDFSALQNGQVPVPYTYSDYYNTTKRYLSTGRDLAGYVHFDFPFQVYYDTLRILTALKFPMAPKGPFQSSAIKGSTFINFGMIDVYCLLGNATRAAIKAAWSEKWRHRVLRPEAFAGLVQNTKDTQKNMLCLNNELFTDHNGINVLNWIKRNNEVQGAPTYLLPLAYPEGSPLHPSYPSGHATIAGACITIIKAIFDDKALISDYVMPVQPDAADRTKLAPYLSADRCKMTVGSELDKLASNIALGRSFSGVHYRADGDYGIALGEEVAIKLLQNQTELLSKQNIKGFELTKLDGTRICINAKTIDIIR